MDSSEEESDEDFQLQHWNNWLEPKNEFPLIQTAKEPTKYYTHSLKSRFQASELIVSDPRFGNWVPPISFLHSEGCKSVLARKNNELINKNIESENNESSDTAEKSNEVGQIIVPNTPIKDKSTLSNKWKVNEDWGERVELNDVTKFSEGDMIWGVVNPSCFGRIRMWVNEYQNLCVLAEGNISKLGSTEVTVISIVNSELLRKMLCLSSIQWTSLCEELIESKGSLNFDAFLDFNVTSKSSLEKLWFFICKRRHFLQDQCMLVKLSGAVKCLKKFEIIPKLVVQDIRHLVGIPIF